MSSSADTDGSPAAPVAQPNDPGELAELLRAERTRALQELAVGIRHEVNNTLAALLANAQLLGEVRGLDAVGREAARAIQTEVFRLAELTEPLQRVEELPRVPYLGSVVMIDVSAPPLPQGACTARGLGARSWSVTARVRPQTVTSRGGTGTSWSRTVCAFGAPQRGAGPLRRAPEAQAAKRKKPAAAPVRPVITSIWTPRTGTRGSIPS